MKTPIKNLSFVLILLFCGTVAKAQHTNAGAKPGTDSLSSAQSHRPVLKHRRKKWPEFHYPEKQFFFQGQAVMGGIDLGFRFAAGYRLGQYGIIGGGAGMDAFLTAIKARNNTDPYQGYYFPIFAHYEGDIIKKKRVTPVYSAEAGYAVRFSNSSNNNSYIMVTPLDHPAYQYLGGFTGAVDFGVKLYANHKIYATWSVGLNMQQAIDKYSNYYYNSIGEYVKVSYNSPSFSFIPVIKIACGF